MFIASAPGLGIRGMCGGMGMLCLKQKKYEHLLRTMVICTY